MKFLYFILHGIVGCNDDLEYFKNYKAVCRKCGRNYLIFHK